LSTVIEARRLNNTDLGKTISFDGAEGKLRSVSHGYITDPEQKPAKKYVMVTIGQDPHVLAPHDKITITGITKQENQP